MSNADLPPLTRFLQGRRFATAVRSQVDMAAPMERVWSVLSDLESYADWNPFTPRVQGTLQEGAPLALEVHMLRSRPFTQVEHVNSLVEGRRLCWGMQMGHPALLTANRLQTLEAIDGGGTRYVSEDQLSGWLAPLVIRLYGARMQQGFDAMAQALKAHAEAEELKK